NPLPDRGLLLVLVIGTVVITLLVQGFTLAPMVKWAGVAVTPGALHQEDTTARIQLAQAALARLEELADSDAAPPAVIERLRSEYDTRLAYTADAADLIEIEQGELDQLHAAGTITDRTRRKLQRMLDLEDLTLGGE